MRWTYRVLCVVSPLIMVCPARPAWSVPHAGAKRGRARRRAAAPTLVGGAIVGVLNTDGVDHDAVAMKTSRATSSASTDGHRTSKPFACRDQHRRFRQMSAFAAPRASRNLSPRWLTLSSSEAGGGGVPVGRDVAGLLYDPVRCRAGGPESQ